MRHFTIKWMALGLTMWLCTMQAADSKLGPAYPRDRQSNGCQKLASFVTFHYLVDDLLILLIRGEKHCILNQEANRPLFVEPPVPYGIVIIVDDTATSFLGWRRQNRRAQTSAFWKANPQLLKEMVRYKLTPSSSQR